MMIVPLRAEPNQSLQIVLAGQNCTLRFVTRDGVLYSDLAMSGGDGWSLVWAGVACRERVGLKLYPYQAFRGQLVFVDLQGDGDPEWTGLGDRWRLVYLSEEDIASYGQLYA